VRIYNYDHFIGCSKIFALVPLSKIMVGQDASTSGMQQKIDETYASSIAEFELTKQSQGITNKEMAQLNEILLKCIN
jgi:hypothetical protein